MYPSLFLGTTNLNTESVGFITGFSLLRVKGMKVYFLRCKDMLSFRHIADEQRGHCLLPGVCVSLPSEEIENSMSASSRRVVDQIPTAICGQNTTVSGGQPLLIKRDE